MLCGGSRADSIQRDQCAQMERALIRADGMEPFHGLDVHQPFGRGDFIFHQGEQVTAAGQNFHFAPALAEQRGHLVWSGGRGVIKRSHCCLLSG
jgi:hypothetical protein